VWHCRQSCAALTARQEHAIGIAVRIVADHATLDFHRRMLEDVRPSLLDGEFKGQRLITQSGSTVVIQDRAVLEKLVGA